MKKQKQAKIISIVALLIAITAMTIGFAAFSNILTISSSATVTPLSSAFKIKIYGLNTVVDWDLSGDETLFRVGENVDLSDLSLYSETTALAFSRNDSVTASNAIIDNNLLSISNISSNFISPGDGM